MNVRLENLQYDAGPSNYVSFLGHAPKSKGKQADEESLKSVSSMRSVMSSMSSLWANMTSSTSAAKVEKQMVQYREDIRYLYSCFTKIPALKLSPDHRARLVVGFEEFPFDTAVPLFAFKNVSALEICDLDFRQFHGWDRLAEQLKSLTVKRANVDDPIDLLQHIVLDDIEKRRKRSFKTGLPATPSTPGAPWPTSSPKFKHAELARTMSAPGSPFVGQRQGPKNSPPKMPIERKDSSDLRESCAEPQRERSTSPTRPVSRHGSLTKHARNDSTKNRRSSGSSNSDMQNMTPRHSATDLLAINILPPSKWRFLRHLGLPENGLHTLAVSSLVPVASTLQSLDLSGNLFSEVPDALASLTHLRALNLSNCMIDSLQSLARNPLPAITTLNLRSNRLLNLSGIERMISLERVDFRDNRLRDPTELARLTAFPNITDIYVIKNPFARTHGSYRVTIFNLFRKTPGNLQDVNIDSLGPVYSEKKQLVDRAPEQASAPVVKPPIDDDEEDQPVNLDGIPEEASLGAVAPHAYEEPSQRRSHRRTTSDLGPQGIRQKKKAPRRRIIELSQAEADSPARPKSQTSERSIPDLAEAAPKTPTDSDQPSTPEQTPYQTAPTTQVPTLISPKRPTLAPAFESPTPAPKIRDPSDDDSDSPVELPRDLGHSNMYRQKIEALKSDLGPNWLAALNDERATEQQTKIRSFSPSSRTSTIRADESNRAASFGSRALG